MSVEFRGISCKPSANSVINYWVFIRFRIRVNFINDFVMNLTHVFKFSGQGQTQRGLSTQGQSVGRNDLGMLQLRVPECFLVRVHSCQVRKRCGTSLPGALFERQWLEGHELGSQPMVTFD